MKRELNLQQSTWSHSPLVLPGACNSPPAVVNPGAAGFPTARVASPAHGCPTNTITAPALTITSPRKLPSTSSIVPFPLQMQWYRENLWSRFLGGHACHLPSFRPLGEGRKVGMTPLPSWGRRQGRLEDVGCQPNSVLFLHPKHQFQEGMAHISAGFLVVGC